MASFCAFSTEGAHRRRLPHAAASDKLGRKAMIPKNRAILDHRVRVAAEAALAAKKYVTSIDVLVGMGWLEADAVERWRRGQIAYLERVVQANLSRVSGAMKLFRRWAAAKGLSPSETVYLTRKPHRRTLRFSRSGDHNIERHYRTHWVSAALSQKKRQERSRIEIQIAQQLPVASSDRE